MTNVLRVTTRLKAAMLATVLVAACNPVRGCPESNFDLKAESRLPIWFSVPAGMERHDLNVRLTYYNSHYDDAVLELTDRNGHSHATATGQFCWHPEMYSKTNADGGLSPDSYPHYGVITVKGLVEVVEHVRWNRSSA